MFCSDVKESWVLIEGDWRVGERERERERERARRKYMELAVLKRIR